MHPNAGAHLPLPRHPLAGIAERKTHRVADKMGTVIVCVVPEFTAADILDVHVLESAQLQLGQDLSHFLVEHRNDRKQKTLCSEYTTLSPPARTNLTATLLHQQSCPSLVSPVRRGSAERISRVPATKPAHGARGA